MNGFMKIIFILLIIVYIVSPVDLLPGPIDDIIVALLGVAMVKNRSIEEQ